MKRHLLNMPSYVAIWLTIAVSTFRIFCTPCKTWSKACGIFQAETLKTPAYNERELKTLARFVFKLKNYFPWKVRCLEQALTVHYLLKKRGYNHTLYFGMLKDDRNQWRAHAWVRCGDTWVIGYQPEQDYTVVGTYAAIVSEHD